MMANFEEHAKTDYKNHWLYFTVFEDEEAGGYYVDIFDRQGRDVAQLPTNGHYSTKKEASSAAIDFIQEREAKSREISPQL